MIERIVKTLDCTNIVLPRKLMNKVVDTVGTEASSLQSMPEKRDIVVRRIHPAELPDEVINISDRIEKKLSKYMRIIPEQSRMSENLEFNINELPFEMNIDKTKKNVNVVNLKQIITSGDSAKGSSTILNIEFDKNGKMINGNLVMDNERGVEHYKFSRLNKNKRRIDYESSYNGRTRNRSNFRPLSNNDVWNFVMGNQKRSMEEAPRLNCGTIGGDPLGIVFFDLTGLKKTII